MISALEISHSLHLSDIKLPAGVKSLSREDATLVTIVPPSGYAEEMKAAAAAAAAGPAAVAAPVLLRRGCGGCRACGGCCRSGGGCEGACRVAIRRSKRA